MYLTDETLDLSFTSSLFILCVVVCSRRYDPRKWIAANPELAHCLEQIRSGYYNPAEPDLFQDIYRSLVTEDRFLICADYEDYMRAQAEVEYAYSVSDRANFRVFESWQRY